MTSRHLALPSDSIRVKPSRNIRAAVALALGLAAGSAMATPAITSFNTGAVFGGFSPTVATVGWQFTVDANAGGGTGITVDALGWWDETPGTPLAVSHQVGIWDLGGTLLATTTVLPTDTLIGDFRYSSIADLVLDAGSSYLIGGYDLSGDGDRYTSGVGALVLDSLISFNGAARNTTLAFSAPSTISASSGGRFGPNFDFTENSPAPAGLPEPGTLAITMTALGVLGARRLRRNSKAA